MKKENNREPLPAVGRRALLRAGAAGMAVPASMRAVQEGEATARGELTSDEGPGIGSTYRTATSSQFNTLHPLYAVTARARDAISYTLDQGYTIDANEEVFPLLYDLSTDQGEVWVFNLRENLQFSDPYGQVTADDFLYYIEEVIQSDWAAHPDQSEWLDVNVTKHDDFQFQAELPESQLLWPETFGPRLSPIPQGLLEQYVEAEDQQGLEDDPELNELQFTGNLGPYVLEERIEGSKLVYSRNEEYYLRGVPDSPELFEGAPYFETAEIEVIPQQSTRLAMLEDGTLDAAGLPRDQFEEFDANPDVDALQIPQSFNNALALNMRDNGWQTGPGNLFRYDEFRQAMACAIDKETLIDEVYEGLAEPHYTWQPSSTRWYPGDDALQTWGVGDLYGEEVAKSLASQAFEQSEHDYGFEDGDLVTPDGEQCVIDIYTSQGQTTENQMAEFTADELEENLGLEVDVETIDGGTFQSDYFDQEIPEGEEPPEWSGFFNRGPRNFTSKEPWDTSLVFSFNTYPRNPINSQAFFDGFEAGVNAVAYDPDFDAAGLYEDIRAADSVTELQNLVQELFVNLNEEQPYVMLNIDADPVGYNADLVGPTEEFENGWNFPAWQYSGTVTGTITDGGEPLPDVSLQFTLADSEEPAASTTTDGDGGYERSLRADTYDILVEKLGFQPVIETVTLGIDEQRTLDFDLEPLDDGSVSGTVTDPDGEPAGGVEVEFHHREHIPPEPAVAGVDNPVAVVTTDEDGAYGVDLPPGEYELIVPEGEFATLVTEVSVTENAEQSVDAQLADLPEQLPGGEGRPQDLDTDGLYEDVDGDGTFDIFDVQILFENLDSDAVQDHAELFDFSGVNPGEVNIFDVQGLFNRLDE